MLLQSNPKRQAASTIKAYEYQIWQSVLAWIKLAEGEILFLEGAEDFDKYQNGSVEVIQVKHSPQPVSLRSKNIIQAMNNFWELKELNPEREIKYRYLTIAEPALEKRSPFDKKSGLVLWERCKDPQTDLADLAGFLKELDGLSGDLIKFIEEADCRTLRAELIAPISWDTGNPSYDEIRKEVDRLVVYHGDRRPIPIPSDDSRKAVPHLREKVYHTICKEEDRRLKSADFREVFNKAISISVPVSVLTKLVQLAMGDTALPVNRSLEFSEGNTLQNAVPPFPDPLLRRESVVSALSEELASCSILFLTGSTATGKSVLARLLTQGQTWIWMNFRGVAPVDVVVRLRHVAASVSEQHGCRGAVFDDLDFGGDCRIFENKLNAVLELLLRSDGKAVITSQSPRPTMVQELFNARGVVELTVPNLDESELREFALAHGCPEDEALDVWTGIIMARTRGHPKLVHCQMLNLRRRGWPMPSAADLVDTTAVADVYREARQRLWESVPDDEARLLAHRLSVFAYPFRREHALKLGAIALGSPPKSLSTPGNAFDRLMHGWVERLRSDYFQLSPLLSGVAQEVFDPGVLCTIHARAAYAILESEPIGAVEAQAIMYHGFASGEGFPVQVVVGEILRHVHDESWPSIRQDYFWLLALAIEPGKQIFPSDANTSVLLRVLQYRIAGDNGNIDLAIKIREAWEHEIQLLKHPEMKSRMRMVFLAQIVMGLQVPLSLKCTVNAIMEMLSVLCEPGKGTGFGGSNPLRPHEVITELLNFLAPRCRNMTDLEGFFDALAEDRFASRPELLPLLEEDLERLMFLFDHAWTGELNSGRPAWPSVLESFDRIFIRSLEWGAHACAALAARSIAVIQSEHLMQPQSALSGLEIREKTLPGVHLLLRHVRAKVLYDCQDSAGALQVWDSLIREWTSPPVQVAFQAARWGQECAASNGDWAAALRMARYGEDIAANRGFLVRAVGFRADGALALWKAGEYGESIAAFAWVLDSFEYLPDPDEDLSCHTLQRLVGHAIGWAHDEVHPKGNLMSYWEPPAARFSDPELDSRIRDLPVEDPFGLWWMLAQIECRRDLGDWVSKRLERELRTVNRPNLRVLGRWFQVERALMKGQFQGLLPLVFESLSEFRYAKDQILEEKSLPEDLQRAIRADTSTGFQAHTLEIVSVLLAATVRLAGEGRIMNAPVEKWRADCSYHGVTDMRVMDCLSLLEIQRTVSDYQLSEIVRESTADTSMRLLGAILVLTRKTSEPSDLLYASALLVQGVSQSKLCSCIEADLETLTVEAWQHVAVNQRFKLLMPQFSARAIDEACNESSRGIRKAAQVCLAARNGVFLRIGDMTQVLEGIVLTGCPNS